MSKNLVIVESPGKVKTIQKYLDGFSLPHDSLESDSPKKGKDSFKVVSSYGHVRDLPKKGLNLEPENGWQANYQLLPDKSKVITNLRSQAEKADQIFLATDLDREGEAIAWHLREMIGGPDERFGRVVFNEITESAIHEAFEKRGRIDEDRVNAQQARRFLDRVVGYKLSPLLMQKIARGLSAGRVQSVAVRLIVEREREIRAFNPKEYWRVYADLARSSDQEALKFEVFRHQGENFEIPNAATAEHVVYTITSNSVSVGSINTRNTSSSPSAPYITSTLQQAASTRFGYSVSRTMRLAQDLYEAGLITYMRTDSTNISEEAQNGAAELVKSRFGDEYLPDKPNEYSSRSGAQEAHEAIRPSNVKLDLATLNSGTNSPLNAVQLRNRQAAGRLYDLIWRQFIASQMTPARYKQTTVIANAAEYDLRIRGRRTLFKGHTAVAPPTRANDNEIELPDYQEGESLRVAGTEKKQHFTKPPARFTEARLVSELEKRGIGRPSTYANIISTIQERGYVSVRSKRFYAERIGEVVTDRLIECFTNLLSYEFTAGMEERLDEISVGNAAWLEVLDDYYSDFKHQLDDAQDPENGMRRNAPIRTEVKCQECGEPMAIRVASRGMFLGCSAYNQKGKDSCKNTQNLANAEEEIPEASSNEEVDDEAESKRLLAKRHCSICNSAMDVFLIDKNTKLHICGNSNCEGHELEKGEFQDPNEYHGPVIDCDKCGSEMRLLNGRFGQYFGCSNESCKNTRKPLPGGEVAAPPVHMEELAVDDNDDYFVLREGRAGIFLGASKYPKVRVIRPPRIKELLSHANEIDPKFQYLLEAPVEDDEGNDTFVRFARKSREHYLTSMIDKKDTGWRAYHRSGYWESVPPKRPAAKTTKKTSRG